jgi:hypothetical protein
MDMLQQAFAPSRDAGTRRTHQPVRRSSSRAGKCESVFWKGTDHQTVKLIILAARRYELQGKQPGKKNGPLGAVAIEVLEYFANIVDFKTGRLDPSLDTLTKKLCRSRDAVWKALNALRDHGFIDWLRRYIPTNNEGAGPQVQQASNAYRLSLPARAKAALGKYLKPAPAPEDAEQAREEREEALEAHSASLTPADRIRDADIDQDKRERWAGYVERRNATRTHIEATAQPVLFEATLGARKEASRILDKFKPKRESVKQTESRSISIIK